MGPLDPMPWKVLAILGHVTSLFGQFSQHTKYGTHLGQ